VSGPFRLLSGPGDAPVGYGAGPVSAQRIGIGDREGGWNSCSLVARYGLKNVPTHVADDYTLGRLAPQHIELMPKDNLTGLAVRPSLATKRWTARCGTLEPLHDSPSQRPLTQIT